MEWVDFNQPMSNTAYFCDGGGDVSITEEHSYGNLVEEMMHLQNKVNNVVRIRGSAPVPSLLTQVGIDGLKGDISQLKDQLKDSKTTKLAKSENQLEIQNLKRVVQELK